MSPAVFPLDPVLLPVMLEILRRGPVTRAELSALTSLSQASIARTTAPLVRSGLVLELEPVPQPRGRPTVPIDADVNFAQVIGVNLTGSEAHVIRTDMRATILAESITKLPSTEPRQVAEHLRDVIGQIAAGGEEISYIGLTLGGNVPDGKVVLDAPFLRWHDVEFAQMLQCATGIEATLGNDVEGVTIAENWFGAGRETESFIVVTIGAGIGLGVVFQNRILRNYSTGFGLMGDNRFVDPCDGLAYDGNHYLTDAAIEDLYRVGTGMEISVDQIEQLAGAGEVTAVTVARRIATRVGAFIGTAGNFTGAEHAVILGERGGLLTGHTEQIAAGIDAVRHPRARPIRWRIRSENHTYWARGAAVLAVRSLLGAQEEL